MVHRIGVISDTHGLLRKEIREALRICDAILHGGDIDDGKLLAELEKMAPVYAVRGNNDGEWASKLPAELNFELYGVKFYMIHNIKQITKMADDRDVIVYGHSHRYEERREEGKTWLNPGSCGPRRFSLPVSMAVLEIDADQGLYQVKKLEISVF